LESSPSLQQTQFPRGYYILKLYKNSGTKRIEREPLQNSLLFLLETRSLHL
jgi:hypothetical protein